MAKAKEYTVTVDKDSAKLVTAAQRIAVAREAVKKAETNLQSARIKLAGALEEFEIITDAIKYTDDDDTAYGDDGDDDYDF